MKFRLHALAGRVLMLGASTLSCGHAHDVSPPLASATSEQPSTTTAQPPAALQQNHPSESLHPELEKEWEEEPQSVLEAGASLPPTAAASPPAGAESIRAFMLEHFLITTWARDSIVDGNLDVIRAPLMELAEYRYKTVAPGGWMEGIAQLQAAARLTAQAETLGAAATGIAAMARVCGQCHRKQGGPQMLPHYPPDNKAPKSERLNVRMHRHAWAVERLWEGLTAPSDNAWQVGAAALAQAPVAAPKARPALPQAVVNALNGVRRLGVQASNADSPEERATVYGQLLFTCAACHHQDADLEE